MLNSQLLSKLRFLGATSILFELPLIIGACFCMAAKERGSITGQKRHGAIGAKFPLFSPSLHDGQFEPLPARRRRER
jgi:hypothetical protein